jgi:hypothetical protein
MTFHRLAIESKVLRRWGPEDTRKGLSVSSPLPCAPYACTRHLPQLLGRPRSGLSPAPPVSANSSVVVSYVSPCQSRQSVSVGGTCTRAYRPCPSPYAPGFNQVIRKAELSPASAQCVEFGSHNDGAAEHPPPTGDRRADLVPELVGVEVFPHLSLRGPGGRTMRSTRNGRSPRPGADRRAHDPAGAGRQQPGKAPFVRAVA